MINKFGNAEMHYIPMEEIEKDYRECQHDWRCWLRLFIEATALIAVFLLVVFGCAMVQWAMQG